MKSNNIRVLVCQQEGIGVDTDRLSVEAAQRIVGALGRRLYSMKGRLNLRTLFMDSDGLTIAV